MKQYKLRIFFFFALFALHPLLSTDAFALDIKRHALKNGLTVLHAERHNLPIVMVSMLIKAGSLDEPAEKAGLANLTAELLTEGTTKRRSADINEEIEFIGASLNASADSDYTLVSLSVLKKDIDKGFDILSDILLRPAFPEEEITRTKGLIKGSIKQSEESPSYVAEREFKKAVFGSLPYGRLITGSTDTIDSIKKEDIARFHSAYYRPGNSLVSVVGDVSEKELETLLQKFFAAWQPGAAVERPSVHNVRRVKQVRLIDRDLTQANILMGHAGIKRTDPDYYTVSVMNYILGGGGFSSRLMDSIRDDKGLAYDVHSFFSAHKDAGFFEVGVQTRNETAKTVIEEILKQINRIQTEPASEKELEDAKSYLTGSFPRRLDTNRKLADFLAVVEFYGLGNDYIEKYPEYINSVSRDDVLKAAQKYLDPENYILVIVANQAKTGITGKEGKK